ncbi:glycoside hydrolase N-terminal domain-containing protein [Paenibacillus sp. 1P07SE]|uniref:glycoside hydrolase family 95 protein n=1 Tax=Paenibacillus sp. 1P07SE TaxID=3132209 RepID=UPI0039A4B21D
MKLWYDKPAANWREALPIGNGRLGAMLSGGLAADRWQLNEETLWSGGPHHYERPNAHRHLEDVRQAIFQGRNEQAEELFQRHMRGEPAPLQTYLPFCDVGFDYPGHSHAEHYRRELDLERSVSTVSYSVDGVDYQREVFCSYPDQAIVMRVTASRSATLNVSVSLHSLYEQSTVAAEGGDTLVLRGSVGPRPGARRKWVAGWEGAGLRYEARLRVESENGSVRVTEDGVLDIRDADALTVYFTGATSFVDYRDDGGDPASGNRAHEACLQPFISGAAATAYRGLYVPLQAGRACSGSRPR